MATLVKDEKIASDSWQSLEGGAARWLAVGDVLRDQLLFMKRSGFDSFSLRDDQDPDEAIAAFRELSEEYQASSTQPQPLFRRRPAHEARAG